MDRFVNCHICLEDVHIESCWCVISEHTRHYECKDTVQCNKITVTKFPRGNPCASPPAPIALPVVVDPIVVDPPIVVKPPIEEEKEIVEWSRVTILSKIKRFLFGKNIYTKVKSE